MCDFESPITHNYYPQMNTIKLDETIFLCPLHIPSRDCEKFAIIQDVDTDPKFFKKVVELWNYEKQKEDILAKIEKDKSLYEKVKALVNSKK
jgi:hypothetical protein